MTDPQKAALTADDIMALTKGGGGGNSGGMDPRIAKIETDVARLTADLTDVKSDMKSVKSDLVDVKVGLAKLQGEVSRLPGYPGIATIMALVGGGLLIVARLFPAGTP